MSDRLIWEGKPRKLRVHEYVSAVYYTATVQLYAQVTDTTTGKKHKLNFRFCRNNPGDDQEPEQYKIICRFLAIKGRLRAEALDGCAAFIKEAAELQDSPGWDTVLERWSEVSVRMFSVYEREAIQATKAITVVGEYESLSYIHTLGRPRGGCRVL